MAEHEVPEPPRISAEDLAKCRESGDYCLVFFEWYKFVGALCNFFARISQDSPAIRTIEPLHYSVLIGLLNRCSRLMLSNVALSHNGLFGETTALIDRCIFESCVKAAWLCLSDSKEMFTRFVADGLKTELELKDQIEAKIAARAGNGVLEIEKRMLSSISRHLRSSGLADQEIATAKKLPDLAAMLDALGQHRLTYVVGQRLGSHHVHGTWPSLRMHYLEDKGDGVLQPRDHDCATHVNQYIMVPLVVLDAMRSFVTFIFQSQDDIEPMVGLVESVIGEIQTLNEEVIGRDFTVAEKI